MNFQPADTLSLSFFSIFALIMALVILKTLRRPEVRRIWLILFSVFLLIASGAALSGVVVEHFIPVGPLLLGSMFILGLLFVFSPSGSEVSKVLSLTALVSFQAFRLPLELLLHHWADIGTVPPTMTWTGQNWDILSGILALAVIPFLRSLKVAMAFNLIGLALLLNVLRVVIMSSPLPFAWDLERPIMLIGYFPYVLIGPLFVLPALVGHLLIFRKVSFRAIRKLEDENIL